jgi:hypothetical protein
MENEHLRLKMNSTKNMHDFKLPPMGRRIISDETPSELSAYLNLPDITPASQSPSIEDPRKEKSLILKRLQAIISEHLVSADRLGITFSAADIRTVLSSLRAHAKNGTLPEFNTISKDEIHCYILESLFAELVEEPSNILYTTKTGEDTMRYDAMQPSFWIECLDLLETKLHQLTS